MARVIVFENTGEVELLMLNTFGVNVKDNEDAIGFFGTGMKYALAITQRLNCWMVVQSGLSELSIGTRKKEIRGKEFHFVTVNNELQSFTTELGKNWEAWMAFRELYCNALDEGGTVYDVETTSMPVPEEGVTRFMVQGEAMWDVYLNKDKYFLSSQALASMGNVDVHPSTGAQIYYKKIFVGMISEAKAVFSYNFKGSVDLTEDRTVKHGWNLTYALGRGAVVGMANKDVLRRMLMAPTGSFEANLDMDHATTPSNEFLEVMAELVKDKVAHINKSALRTYERHIKKSAVPETVKLTIVEQKMLDKAIIFCKGMGYGVDEYPIKVVETLGTDQLGMAKDREIYLAHRAFTVGTKCVAGTLFEEFCHLKHSYGDMERGFQNFLIDTIVSLGEQINGEPL